jgi:DnaJ-class molecular chaperone with C-terminal Zn finger domain
MGSFKWIAGFLGWVAGGPIGALLGFLAGTAVESFVQFSRQLTGGEPQAGGTTRSSSTRGYTANEQRNSFMVSLLVLSSAVIRADGRTHPKELDLVREFIRRNFGDQAVDEAMRILDGLNAQQVNIYSVGEQIAANMNYSQRLQLFHYLTQIAAADRDFSKEEKSVLEAIASAIRLTSSDAASVIAMHYKDTDSAYAVLEISPNATNEEVKSAYRRMAMKHHPDKVSTLGPEVQKAAEEKFRKIQEAYETIKKERGL